MGRPLLHLSLIASKRCGLTIYCNTIIRPAYCPFCLNEATPSASSRLQSWSRDRDLWDHLEAHIEKSLWPSSCPHPLCDLQLNDEESFYYHLSDIHSLRRCGHRNGHNRKTGNQKRKRLEGDIHNGKKQKHVEGVLQTDVIRSSPPETCTPSSSIVMSSPAMSKSCTSAEMVACSTDPTISPNSTLLSPIRSSTKGDYDENDSSSPLDYLEGIIDCDMNELNEEAQRAEPQANPTETIDIPVVDLTEDNSYDGWLSQCITIPSSPCSSIKGASNNEDDNEGLPNTINYNLVELNEEAHTKLTKPRIKLRLNPPKPKILLTKANKASLISKKRYTNKESCFSQPLCNCHWKEVW
ncbi:hypothetical protein V8E54_002004 [Elaphomyces granulatus]